MIIQTSNYKKSSSTIAFIVATYPSGSTCTCTNGTITLTATDTSGSYVFEIPSIGTWTSYCTNGIDTNSVESVISSIGQSISVRLSYDFVIFESGKGALVPFTTKNQSSNSGVSISTSNINLYYTAASYCGCFARTTNALDLTKYNTLQVVMNVTGTQSYGTQCLGITSNAPTSYSDYALSYIASCSRPSTGQQTINVSISSLSSGYFAVGTFLYGTITKVVLLR